MHVLSQAPEDMVSRVEAHFKTPKMQLATFSNRICNTCTVPPFGMRSKIFDHFVVECVNSASEHNTCL